MAKIVLGVFNEQDSAENAIERLKDEGYNPKDISIVMKDANEGRDMSEDTGADVMAGTVSGVTTGAIVGGLAGLLSSFAIPGLGAFFIGGPLVSALGLTGAAATTVSGAATGALAGGVLGALTGIGLSDEDARTYEEKINEGGILVAVPARRGEEAEVEQILNDTDAVNIKSITNRMNVSDEGYNTDFAREEAFRGNSPSYAYATSKGGKSKKSKKNTTKGGRSTKSRGRGWHGDPKGHAMAARGEDVPGRGEGK